MGGIVLLAKKERKASATSITLSDQRQIHFLEFITSG
jgi:hypothetical protein